MFLKDLKPGGETQAQPFFSDSYTLKKERESPFNRGVLVGDADPTRWSEGSAADAKCLKCHNAAICRILNRGDPQCVEHEKEDIAGREA